MWTYGELLATVKEWSLQHRAESRDKGNMNVDQVHQEEQSGENKEGTQEAGSTFGHGNGIGEQPWQYDPWSAASSGFLLTTFSFLF